MSCTLTLASLIEASAKTDAIFTRRIMVGIVVRPEFKSAVINSVAEFRPSNARDQMFGTPIYVDHRQEVPWLPFFDEKLLGEYLRRHDPKPVQELTYEI